MRRPAFRAIAHRGASHRYPENTLAAFGAALRYGCDAIELDVQLSRDGVPVVYHDRTLIRAGGGRSRVAERTLRELHKLDAGTRFEGARRAHRIPTLEAVLERFGAETDWLIELKLRRDGRHLQLLERVLELVHAGRLERQVSVLCFEAAILDACRSLAPRIPRVLNLRPPPLLGPALRRRLRRLAALSVDVSTLTPRFAAGLRQAGCPLLVYTCNTPRHLERALAAGAVGVMSDRIDWLVARRDDRA